MRTYLRSLTDLVNRVSGRLSDQLAGQLQAGGQATPQVDKCPERLARLLTCQQMDTSGPVCGPATQPTDRHTDPLPARSEAEGSGFWNYLTFLGPQTLISSLERKGLGFFTGVWLPALPFIPTATRSSPGSLPQLPFSCQGWPPTVFTGWEEPPGCHRRRTHSSGLRTLLLRGALISIRELDCLLPVPQERPQPTGRAQRGLTTCRTSPI